MEFQYTKKAKQMFEDIKKNIQGFPDIRDICCETITENAIKKIAKEYDDFILHEFEKRGYTLEELQSGRHELFANIEFNDRIGQPIHEYFADGECIFWFVYKRNII